MENGKTLPKQYSSLAAVLWEGEQGTESLKGSSWMFFIWYCYSLAQWTLFHALLEKPPNMATADRFKVFLLWIHWKLQFFFFLFPEKEIPLFSLRTHRGKHIFQNSVSTLPWSVPHQISPRKSPVTNLLQTGNTPDKYWPLMTAPSSYILNWVDILCHLIFNVSILILFMWTHVCMCGKILSGEKERL